jgi:hypothetical protein
LPLFFRLPALALGFTSLAIAKVLISSQVGFYFILNNYFLLTGAFFLNVNISPPPSLWLAIVEKASGEITDLRFCLKLLEFRGFLIGLRGLLSTTFCGLR